nr:hypothetical protein [uncultured Blautia sp.]
MVPKLNEARELLRNYDQGDFHLLQGEIVSGIMGYFSRQFEPENEEYWGSLLMKWQMYFGICEAILPP